MNYQKFYIGRVLNATSQWFNAVIIFGNPDVSISARIGEHNYFYNDLFYKLCGWIVDKTFYPIDGKYHCKQAYLRDRKEDYTVGKGWIIGEVLMCIIVVIACVVLAPFFWGYYGCKNLIKK
jgi:hypothetical protein